MHGCLLAVRKRSGTGSKADIHRLLLENLIEINKRDGSFEIEPELKFALSCDLVFPVDEKTFVFLDLDVYVAIELTNINPKEAATCDPKSFQRFATFTYSAT